MNACIRMHTLTLKQGFTAVCMYAIMLLYECMCVCVYVCMCVYVCSPAIPHAGIDTFIPTYIHVHVTQYVGQCVPSELL